VVIVVVFDASQRAPASRAMRSVGSAWAACREPVLAAQACHRELQVMSTLSGEQVEPEVARVLGIAPPWRDRFAGSDRR
jgi:hypothetical protein